VEVEEYARIAAVEDDHWWYRNTRALVAEQLAARLAGRDDLRVLDAGCGPGGNGAWLAAHGDVVGVDRAPDALRFVHERRPRVAPVLADLTALPLAASAFDVVVAITVLYAVPDHQAATHELARVLAPDGVLVVLEPAFEALRREHDATVHGVRRYRRPELRALLTGAGLRIRRSTYAYSFLAPAAAGLAWADRRHVARHSSSDVERRGLDRAFAPLAYAERRALARLDLPVGTSVMVVATH
jgi:SAM-dependent methyltransferase